MWKGIKKIINFKPQLSNKFVKTFENNQEISNVSSAANNFNIYFANIGSELSNLIGLPNEKNSPLDYLSK